ncbi:MAG: protein kinase, partial [Paracoccaceae bacterium]|nr:protein kinase [Paracoccaceae bacterium]
VQGLSYAHRKNLVHRDIKPANILLQEESGELIPKIVDFGLAQAGRAARDDGSRILHQHVNPLPLELNVSSVTPTRCRLSKRNGTCQGRRAFKRAITDISITVRMMR